jgi:hypothetical protein
MIHHETAGSSNPRGLFNMPKALAEKAMGLILRAKELGGEHPDPGIHPLLTNLKIRLGLDDVIKHEEWFGEFISVAVEEGEAGRVDVALRGYNECLDRVGNGNGVTTHDDDGLVEWIVCNMARDLARKRGEGEPIDNVAMVQMFEKAASKTSKTQDGNEVKCDMLFKAATCCEVIANGLEAGTLDCEVWKQRATNSLMQVVTIDEAHPDANFALGLHAATAGKSAAAVHYLKKAVEGEYEGAAEYLKKAEEELAEKRKLTIEMVPCEGEPAEETAQKVFDAKLVGTAAN